MDKISPEEESRLLTSLLTYWALRGTLDMSAFAASARPPLLASRHLSCARCANRADTPAGFPFSSLDSLRDNHEPRTTAMPVENTTGRHRS